MASCQLSFFKEMDRKQIKKLLEEINEIIECLECGESRNVYNMVAGSASLLQTFLIFLLENGILEQELTVMLMSDIVKAVEQKDDVLMLDTLKYGIRNLLWDIVKIVGEDDE